MTIRPSHPSTTSSHHPPFVRLLVASLLLTLALVLSSGSAALIPSVHAASVAQASSSVPAQSFPIRVFFSKFPVSVNTNFAAVFPVNRVSPTSAVATFSIQLLIAGQLFRKDMPATSRKSTPSSAAHPTVLRYLLMARTSN